MRWVHFAMLLVIGLWLGYALARRPVDRCARRRCEGGAPALVFRGNPITLEVRATCECVSR